MITNKTYYRHIAAIRHTVTRSNIIGIRKALNAFHRNVNGWSISCTSPVWTYDMFRQAMDAVQRYQPVISGDMHESGIATLQRAVRRYKGRFNAAQSAIIADIWHFRLAGWHLDDNNYYPVIRVTARNGEWFDFINIPWQSNSNGPTVVHCSKVTHVKPLFYCSVSYVTPSGKRVHYSRSACTGESIAALRDYLFSRLRNETNRKVAHVLPDTFQAQFMTMQISNRSN
jgi:hypothetical protein